MQDEIAGQAVQDDAVYQMKRIRMQDRAVARMKQIIWHGTKIKTTGEEVLCLCTRYPACATVAIDHFRLDVDTVTLNGKTIEFNMRSTLCHLLEREESLQTIEAFLKQHKERLKSPEYLRKVNPLHKACWYVHRITPGAIPLLVKYFPEEATRRFRTIPHSKPLLILLERDLPYRRRHSKDLNTLFMATFPNSCTIDTHLASRLHRLNPAVHTPTPLLLVNLTPEEAKNIPVFEFMVTHLLRNCLQIEKYDSFSFPLIPFTRALITRLNCFFHGQRKLKEIVLTFAKPLERDPGVPMMMLKSLGRIATLQKLSLHLFGCVAWLMDDDTIQALKEISLRELTLGLGEMNEPQDHQPFHPIARRFEDRTQIVLAALCNAKLSKLSLLCDADRQVPLFIITTMQVFDTYVKTEPVFNALRNNSSLQEMVITSHASYEDLEGLVTTLWHYNTTLQSVQCCTREGERLEEDPRRSVQMIHGFTALNRHGRGELKDPKTPLRKLIDLLVICGKYTSVATELSYAVLLETPGKWSSTGHQRVAVVERALNAVVERALKAHEKTKKTKKRKRPHTADHV
jgi:hypothetical protein